MNELQENERIDDLNIAGLKLIQNTKYFCFGMDSVLLSNYVGGNKSSNVIIDFCTGSAVIPILLTAKIRYKKIYGIELQEQMYDLATRNIALNNLENEITVINNDINNVTAIKELLKNDGLNDTVDIITVNPPYKSKDCGVENDLDVKKIARHEIMCSLEDVFNSSSKLLKYGGKLYMVHKPERLTDIICIGRKYGIELKKMRLMQPYIDKKPSIVLLEMVKGAGAEIIVEPNLIEYNQDGSYTDEIYNIYEIKK